VKGLRDVAAGNILERACRGLQGAVNEDLDRIGDARDNAAEASALFCLSREVDDEHCSAKGARGSFVPGGRTDTTSKGELP